MIKGSTMNKREMSKEVEGQSKVEGYDDPNEVTHRCQDWEKTLVMEI